MIQLLDMFGFERWKNFVGSLFDAVILRNYDIDLYQRLLSCCLQVYTRYTKYTFRRTKFNVALVPSLKTWIN